MLTARLLVLLLLDASRASGAADEAAAELV
jgi:hypothetical protein